MKIPFDIKYRPQIESGEYKLETELGNPAFVMDWDWNNNGEKCLAIKVPGQGKDSAFLYTYEGKRASTFPPEEGSDLFLITPEPEPTDWQRLISGCLQKYGLLDCGAADRIAKECSEELLFLARLLM